ncbi:hemin uptake protein HemP [Alphaproteobacteria bacterium KMM 3653]|uniref:Hemin uptake protein HemP n=1 Tax=Harenicola maris TaxID=2841044 RepID=A0AAP2G9G8_9RHOB|nr:hemin uptake protein HemP [Harenicola maris]
MTHYPHPSTLRPAPASLPQYSATQLTQGGNLAEIVLDDQTYRLRITKAGKLILTK